MTWHSTIALSLAVIYINLYISTVVSTKHNVIRRHKFLCGTYAPDLVNITCKFKRVNRTTEFWSFDTYLSPSNINNTDNLFVVHFKFQFAAHKLTVTNFPDEYYRFSRQTNLEWRPHMIVHFIVDVCKYMDNSMGNKFLDIIAKELKTTSNFMHPCPHVGHKYMRNMTLNDENWPPIVPAAEIYIDLQYFMYVKGSAVVKRLHYLRPYLDVKTKGIIYFK